jgi:hypothetical protein
LVFVKAHHHKFQRYTKDKKLQIVKRGLKCVKNC